MKPNSVLKCEIFWEIIGNCQENQMKKFFERIKSIKMSDFIDIKLMQVAPSCMIIRMLFPFSTCFIRLTIFDNFAESFFNSHTNWVCLWSPRREGACHYFSRLTFDPSKWDLKFWCTNFNTGSCDYWKNSKFHEKSIKRDGEV